ncbi:MAG: alpha/beta hydrolase [Prolixibacteraceae bacterium]|nr:alpha/beta hydrolase [Prolixibacteraceae bacterium]
MKNKLSLKEKFVFKYIFNEKRVYKRWYGRFFLFETDYGRLTRVILRINSWQNWCKEWVKEGHCVEALADKAVERDYTNSAIKLYHQAVACYHIGQHFFFIDEEQREEAQENARKVYKKAISLYKKEERPIRIEIPYKGCIIPGYLHLSKEKNRPLIIQTNGMDNIKEAENHYFAKHIVPHNLNFFAFDGPGQGEMWKQMKFDVKDYPNVVSTVIDWFEANDNYDISVDKIALLGFSLGGFLAPFSAAFDKRVKYVVANSGWANNEGLKGIEKLKLHKRGVTYMTGCNNIEDAAIKFNLNINDAPNLECPILYFHAGRDEVINNPRKQAEAIMNWARGEKELRFYENAEHCTVDYLDEVLPYAVDWYLKRFN